MRTAGRCCLAIFAMMRALLLVPHPASGDGSTGSATVTWLSPENRRRVLAGTFAILFAIVLPAVFPARGDTIPSAATGSGYTDSPADILSPVTFASATGVTTASSSGSLSGTNANGSTYDASGSAVVNPDGTLGAVASIAVTGNADSASASSATLVDGLTVTVPGIPTGTAGTLEVTGTVSGTFTPLSGTGPYDISDTFYEVTPSLGSINGSNFADSIDGGSCVYTPTSSTTCSLTYSIPFTFGNEFEMVQWLDTYVFADSAANPNLTAGGTASYGDTAQITSIVVLDDANGSTLTDFDITSASGLDYTANGVSAPEPSSLVLLCVGLLLLGFMAKRKSIA
jgi:PEP-CTERM motif